MKTYVYIDGFNFYHGCIKYSRHKWLDFKKLAENMLPGHEIAGIKYFTAKVSASPGDPDQPNRQMIYWRALRTVTAPEIQIIEGMFYDSTKSMPLANGCRMYDPGRTILVKVQKREEKGSDVNLAAHLLMDGFENRYEQAVLITNDSDLATPVSIVRNHLKRRIGVINPHEHHSKELKRLASFLARVRDTDLANAQFPDELTDAIGTFKKPSRWSTLTQPPAIRFSFTKWGLKNIK